MTTTRNIRIPRGPLELSATVHSPDTTTSRGPAVVVATPGSSVKEQIGANYAARLATAGYTALAFDPAYQGQSSGEPRDLEDPYERAADIRYAVDYLNDLDEIDDSRIGLLGICAGAGYAVHTAMTDHRIGALAVVVPVNIGRAFRQADPSRAAVTNALGEAARQRRDEARGLGQARIPWLPDTEDDAAAAGVTDVDVLQAVRYYRTPRGHNPHSTNRRLHRSDAQLLGFDAFHLASELLTQPLQVIVGGRLGSTGSYADGQQLWEMAPNQDEFVVIDGAGHYELYDEPGYVDPASARVSAFFDRHLGSAA